MLGLICASITFVSHLYTHTTAHRQSQGRQFDRLCGGGWGSWFKSRGLSSRVLLEDTRVSAGFLPSYRINQMPPTAKVPLNKALNSSQRCSSTAT